MKNIRALISFTFCVALLLSCGMSHNKVRLVNKRKYASTSKKDDKKDLAKTDSKSKRIKFTDVIDSNEEELEINSEVNVLEEPLTDNIIQENAVEEPSQPKKTTHSTWMRTPRVNHYELARTEYNTVWKITGVTLAIIAVAVGIIVLAAISNSLFIVWATLIVSIPPVLVLYFYMWKHLVRTARQLKFHRMLRPNGDKSGNFLSVWIWLHMFVLSIPWILIFFVPLIIAAIEARKPQKSFR